MMKVAYGFVLLGVSLLYCQLILGRMRRWSRNWFVLKGAEAAYKLPHLVGTVAMGVMPHEESAAVWILYLIALNDSLACHDAESGQLEHVWTMFNIILFSFRAGGAVHRAAVVGTAGWLAYGFVGAMVCVSAGCKICIILATASKSQSERVADGEDTVLQDDDDPPQVITGSSNNQQQLEGCRYLVDREKTVGDIYRRGREQPVVHDTTVDIVPAAGVSDEELQPEPVRDRELCLSFALFRLLYSRYQGFALCPRKKTTRAFTFGWLLGSSTYARGFRVVEAQLGFLYDHIHGGSVLWSPAHLAFYCTFSTIKALLLYVGVWPLCVYTMQAEAPAPGERSVPRHHAPLPILALLLLHGLFDLLRIILWWVSDRRIVASMCRQRQPTGRLPVENLLRKEMVKWWPWYWQDRIGQYSLWADIIVSEESKPTTTSSSLLLLLGRTQSCYGARESTPVPLPAGLRARFMDVLEQGYRTTCACTPFLRWNPDLSPADGLSLQAKTILKWHIATCYMEHMELRDEQLRHAVDTRDLPVKLSNYCAYLVAFRPELLPGKQLSTRKTFRQVRKDLKSALQAAQSTQGCWQFHNLDKTLTCKDGLRLAHLLEMIRDRNVIWEFLEEIWVKLILSTVPQPSQDDTYAKRHAKYLAQGGEFVTHLWAMLSRADIVHHIYN